MENKRLRIDSAGFIYLENKISAKLSCNMHFERFPMDVQVLNWIDWAKESKRISNYRQKRSPKNDAAFKVCSIKIESLAYYKEDLFFEWISHVVRFKRIRTSENVRYDSEVERLSPSIKFEDGIELSQYKFQGQFSKITETFEDVHRGGLKRGACLLSARNFFRHLQSNNFKDICWRTATVLVAN